MKAWAERPIEEANLLNPAFCCVALTSSVAGYSGVDGAGLPYPISFMVLPIVLHKVTRESLPRDTRTSLAVWVQRNPSAKLQYADRVAALKRHTREAILFGLQHDWLVLAQDGRVRTLLSGSHTDSLLRGLDGEARDCVRGARLVGKWFASAGSPQTVMALWGIRP